MEMTQRCYDCHSLEKLRLMKRKINDGKVSKWYGTRLSGECIQTTMLCLSCSKGAVEVEGEEG